MSQFDLLDPASANRRAQIAADLSTFYAELSGVAPEKQRRFSLTRLITRMNDSNLKDCYEADVCKAAAIAQGRMWSDSRSQIIPWGALLGRGLMTSTPSRGGNLVPTSSVGPLDALLPFSVVARMGVHQVDNLTQDLLLPNITTPVSAQWLENEASTITATDPVIGQVSSAPKTAGALVKASFNFMKQSQFADEVIRTQLLSAVGAALDAAVLAGTGASGQPTGLSIAAGLHAQAGAVTFANMLDAIETLANADAEDEKIKFLTTPSVRRLLQAREITASTGLMLWRNGQLVDRPGYVTTDCPAGTIFAGDWSKVLVAFWGSGIEIVVDPYTNFKSGAIQVRALVHTDVAFTKPQALLRHTSVS